MVIFRLLQKPLFKPAILARNFCSTPVFNSNTTEENDEETEDKDEDGDDFDSDKDFIDRYLDPKDRSRVIPPEISMKYMESVAFKSTYGNDPIWKNYRRNYPVSNILSDLYLFFLIQSFYKFRAAVLRSQPERLASVRIESPRAAHVLFVGTSTLSSTTGRFWEQCEFCLT